MGKNLGAACREQSGREYRLEARKDFLKNTHKKKTSQLLDGLEIEVFICHGFGEILCN